MDGPAKADRKAGPLYSLLNWLRCAVQTWPEVSLVGKADDDVWINLPGTAEHLRGSLARLQDSSHPAPPRMLWGIMETFGWNTSSV